MRVIASRRIYEGAVVALRVDEVETSDGRRRVREIVEHRGAVAAVPLLPDGSVLLVRQHREAAGGSLLEIPAGTVEPGEDPETALQRELAEEIGMRAGRLTRLTSFLPSPGFLTEVVHVYLARDLAPDRRQAEEEDLEVVRLPLERARAMVASGEIRDAKSVIGLLLSERAVGLPGG
ncbi:MAG: NUDIX hydrolase [Armatimonadota bacterium]|nr:NUDIX hydrolase [Armatimonadota bacterium]MDR7450379.1 NUDIX hydrolase [Armatimonadota bacterium]MDR7467038.1 NUDIX hydrolase [Armatimonadota bacterium]MDR7493420.1 NUDIX hydrolase [Armatimonadota bacterium]MDR7498685.1 NUDIX hydrolase [Armatimonadota bacterium]